MQTNSSCSASGVRARLRVVHTVPGSRCSRRALLVSSAFSVNQVRSNRRPTCLGRQHVRMEYDQHVPAQLQGMASKQGTSLRPNVAARAGGDAIAHCAGHINPHAAQSQPPPHAKAPWESGGAEDLLPQLTKEEASKFTAEQLAFLDRKRRGIMPQGSVCGSCGGSGMVVCHRCNGTGINAEQVSLCRRGGC